MSKLIVPFTKEEIDKKNKGELKESNLFLDIEDKLKEKVKDKYKELYGLESELLLGVVSFDNHVLDLEYDLDIIKDVIGEEFIYRNFENKTYPILEISITNFEKLTNPEISIKKKDRVINRLGAKLDNNIILGFIPIKEKSKERIEVGNTSKKKMKESTAF